LGADDLHVGEEILVVTMRVVYRGEEPLDVSGYEELFHGSSWLCYGSYRFRYPVTSVRHQRLVASFMREFRGIVVADVGANQTEEW